MQTARSITAEIKSRGQLTIPKKIRVMSRLEEGQVVSIIPVGDSVITRSMGSKLHYTLCLIEIRGGVHKIIRILKGI